MRARVKRYAVMTAVGVVTVAAAVVLLRPGLVERLLRRAANGGETPLLAVQVPRAQYPVKGIDISHHNGDIDFAAVAADSVDFVIIKATEGATHRDSCVDIYYDGATKAGLTAGFYHFFRFERGGVRQGRNFLQTVQDKPTPLPLVIDFESNGNPGTDYYLVVGRLRDMAAYLRRHGRRIMIYCNHTDYERYIAGNFDDTDLWLASGRLPAHGDRRCLWQHSHNGRVAGIDRPVDINTFNGSRADFDAWLALTPGTAPADTAAADTAATQ